MTWFHQSSTELGVIHNFTPSNALAALGGGMQGMLAYPRWLKYSITLRNTAIALLYIPGVIFQSDNQSIKFLFQTEHVHRESLRTLVNGNEIIIIIINETVQHCVRTAAGHTVTNGNLFFKRGAKIKSIKWNGQTRAIDV